MTERKGRSTPPDRGFGLIELIVVIAIMGVLTATAVPNFVGLQSSVRQAATQADLGNDRTALVAYAIDNNGIAPAQAGFDPRGSGSYLLGYGWQQSNESTSFDYFTNADRTSWCLEMTNVTGAVYRISENKPTKQESCGTLGVNNY